MIASQRSRLHQVTPAVRAPSARQRIHCVPNAFLNKFLSFSKAKASKSTLNRLLELATDGDRGLTTTPQQLAEIKQCFEELEASGLIGTESNISGTWKLLWTTEKVNFVRTKLLLHLCRLDSDLFLHVYSYSFFLPVFIGDFVYS